MPQPKSLLAYRDLIEGILDKALDSERGLRLEFPDPAVAFSTRMRLYAALSHLKKQSKAIYPPDHTLHGRTPYDYLVIQLTGTTLFIRKTDPDSIAEALGATMTEL